jgi:hypothetical protein
MQNSMGRDIHKSIKQIGFLPENLNINENIRNTINESYYFGYKWKDSLQRLTNYTHSKPIYKLIITDNSYILEKLNTYVVMENFKLVNIDIYICITQPDDSLLSSLLTSSYQDNIEIIEQYVLNDKNKNKISNYKLKILENDGIFSIMDSNYNIIKHNGILESSIADGYIKSVANISSLLEHFIKND